MFSIVSIKNCNHKSLGIYYLYSSLLFGISGTLCSMILRLELYSSGHRIISIILFTISKLDSQPQGP